MSESLKYSTELSTNIRIEKASLSLMTIGGTESGIIVRINSPDDAEHAHRTASRVQFLWNMLRDLPDDELFDAVVISRYGCDRLAKELGEITTAIGAAANWKPGQRVLEEQIRSLVDEVLVPPGRYTWLSSPNEGFGGRSPQELIDAGEGERVKAALEHIRAGNPL